VNCACGKGVRLRALKVRVNGKRGVAHYLEHTDCSPLCVEGKWLCSQFKPYPKNENDREWRRMMDRFEAAVSAKEAESE